MFMHLKCALASSRAPSNCANKLCLPDGIAEGFCSL